MALEDILDAIRSEADAEIDRIRAESADAITAVLDEGLTEAKSVEEAASASLDEQAAQQRARIVNRAHLVVERRLRTAADEVYEELLTEVVQRLARQRDSPDYVVLFRRLFDECREVLPDARILRVDPADEDLANHMLAEVGIDSFSIDPSLDSAGGLELLTDDRRRCVRNTLEARIDRADRVLRSLAATKVPALYGGA